MSSHESIDRPEAAAASDAASAAASDVASDEQYRLTHASQIGTVLRDLAWQKCTLNVRSGRGRETVSSVLHVDPASRTFIFDWCRTDEEARAVLEAEENAISASLRGVPRRPGSQDQVVP